MNGELLALAPALGPIVAGCVVLLLSAYADRDAAKGWAPTAGSLVTIAGLAAGLLATGYGWRAFSRVTFEPFGGAVIVDPFGLLCAAVILLAALTAVLAATDSIARRRLALGEAQALISFAAAGAVLMVMAGDLLSAFLGLEVVSLAAYTLTALHRTNRRSSEAALKYFVLGAFASGFMLYGLACTYGACGSFAPAALAEAINGSEPMLGGLAAALLLIGFAFKVGAVPFHQWVPDAYEGAPAAITGFMATVVKIAAFGALTRVVLAALRGHGLAEVLQVVAILTMVGGNLLALMQRSVKRLLAYSSVAHAGYALVALVALAQNTGRGADAIQGLMVYLLTYSVASLGAFGVVAALERVDGTPLEVTDCRGLAARRPWLAGILTVCLLSLAGLPPLAGFFGKYLIFLAAVRVDLVPLAVVGVASSLIGLVYYLRLPLLCFAASGEGNAPDGEAADAPPVSGWMRLSLALSLAGTVWLGFGPSFWPVVPGVNDLLRWTATAAAGLLQG
jgi:NADH-quinone oxidoreductase subunit N